jgi:hypothetical protein
MIPMKIAKWKIALLFAILLIWTLGMSLISIMVGNELNAAGLGAIIFVGAIVVFISGLTNHIAKITQSKIAQFFAWLLPWMLTMTFGKVFIFGDELKATGLGVDFLMGTIVAFIMVLVIPISKKPSRG